MRFGSILFAASSAVLLASVAAFEAEDEDYWPAENDYEPLDERDWHDPDDDVEEDTWAPIDEDETVGLMDEDEKVMASEEEKVAPQAWEAPDDKDETPFSEEITDAEMEEILKGHNEFAALEEKGEMIHEMTEEEEQEVPEHINAMAFELYAARTGLRIDNTPQQKTASPEDMAMAQQQKRFLDARGDNKTFNATVGINPEFIKKEPEGMTNDQHGKDYVKAFDEQIEKTFGPNLTEGMKKLTEEEEEAHKKMLEPPLEAGGGR